MRKLILLLISALTITASEAQWVNGRVLGEYGSGASSVHVNFKNRKERVLTNADGSFKILASNLGDTLVFSSPGFEPYEVVVTEKNIKDPAFEVVLLNKRAATRADETSVTVTGSGIKREAKLYGSSSAKSPTYAPLYAPADAKKYAKSVKDLKAVNSERRKYFHIDSARAAKVLAAKTLTAGEVNDFMKWKMWEDISVTDFAVFSTQWGMRTKNRFSIQLQDKHHNAIINEPVHLIKKSNGDTVWTTISDNTGKAELWADMFSAKPGADDYIIATKKSKLPNPSEFQQGLNFLTVDKSCEAPPAVDISIVVDATGSMGDEIEFLKLELEEVLKKIPATYPDLDIQYSSVFYRDRGDQYVTKHVDFQSEMLKVLNFVKLQSAGGGGDFPEALDSALSVGIDQLNWRKESIARIMFLFLDAPPHDYAKGKIHTLIQKAAAKGIRIIPLACSGIDKSTEFLLRAIALATNGTYTFLTDNSGVGGAHIKPTTDAFKVELLSDLLQRVLQQCIYAKKCFQKVEPPVISIVDPLVKDVLKVTIYPNPTSGVFNVSSSAELKELFLTDFTGKILMKISSESSLNWRIDASRYPSATYLIKYVTKDNVVGYKQVVVSR